ncbi:MAG: AraC family transcriptional regulator ligand-binding domain-containing protein [Pseudomonadota bacterium]
MRPFNSEPTVAADIVQVYRTFLANFQVDVQDVYRRAGFDRVPHSSTGAKVPLNAVSELLEVSAQAASEPELGLRFVLESSPGYLGMLDHLLLSSPTIGDAFVALEDFIELSVAPARARLAISGQTAVVTVSLPRLLSAPSQQFVDLFAATIVRRIKPVEATVWYPEQISLPRYRPPQHSLYEEVFGPRINFEASELRLVLARSDLQTKQVNVCLGLHDTVRLAAQNLFAESGRQSDFADIVVDAISARLQASRRADLSSVARELSISPRTLQWKLSMLETSFEEVLARVRIELATSMLRDTSLPLGEIGLRIGLSEGSAFTRWSKQHFDMAPGVYRKSLRGQV